MLPTWGGSLPLDTMSPGLLWGKLVQPNILWSPSFALYIANQLKCYWSSSLKLLYDISEHTMFPPLLWPLSFKRFFLLLLFILLFSLYLPDVISLKMKNLLTLFHSGFLPPSPVEQWVPLISEDFFVTELHLQLHYWKDGLGLKSQSQYHPVILIHEICWLPQWKQFEAAVWWVLLNVFLLLSKIRFILRAKE